VVVFALIVAGVSVRFNTLVVYGELPVYAVESDGVMSPLDGVVRFEKPLLPPPIVTLESMADGFTHATVTFCMVMVLALVFSMNIVTRSCT
jgi:hypothetical protein